MIEPSNAEPLLTCLRLDRGDGKHEKFKSLTAADWDAAVEQSRLHGVMSLLFWEIKNRSGQAFLSQARWQELRTSYVNSASRNVLLYRELADILNALQPAGIPVTLLKGIHLAKWVYPEIALRPMTDIDLLLRRDDLSRAASILQRMGYRFSIAFNFERYLRGHQHIPPLHLPGKASVELHWHIATPGSPPRIDLEGLWARAQPVDVGGAPALVLPTEDLLLHLSFHLLQDEFKRGLKRLYDIVILISLFGERLDWSQLQLRAEQWNCSKSLFLVLHLAYALLNAPVPQRVVEQLCPTDYTSQIDNLARQRVLSGYVSSPELNPDLMRLRRRRPLRAKAARLFAVLFPYPEYVAAKLSLPRGSKMVYLYYPVWLKYLARRYGWEFWRVLRNDDEATRLAQHENMLSDWWMAGEG